MATICEKTLKPLARACKRMLLGVVMGPDVVAAIVHDEVVVSI